jgi:CheY-like chemotaxis protein
MNDETLNGPLTLLIVHDNDEDCRFISKLFLTYFGQAVDTVRNVNQALMRFDASVHDLVILDNFVAGITGAELAHILKLRSPATRVVCYSANPPLNRDAFDLVVQKSDLQPMLKEELGKLLSTPRPVGPSGNSLWIGSPNYEGRSLKQV